MLSLFLCLNLAYAQTGTLEERSFMQGDSLRSYLLYVPDTYDGSAAWPLVLNYHGYNIDGAFQMAIDKMDSVANEMQFLVAFPQGLLVDNPLDGTTGPGWNLTGTLSTNDDIAFTEDIINHIKADYLVDDDRIHATGWSMGSEMAFQVACSLDQIASVAGVSGQMTDVQIDSCVNDNPTSALIMHGTSDPLVPFEGADLLDGSTLLPVQETIDFWKEQNNCTAIPLLTVFDNLVENDSSNVQLSEHTLCDQNRVVQFYQINNGGHTWPGGSWPGGTWPGFLGHVNRDINASDVILRFFEEHQKTVVQSGQWEERFVMHEDSLRRYLLYIPDSYDGTSGWPLVLNYHGLLTNSEFQAEVSQMSEAADAMQYLVAYPQGLDVLFPNFPVGPGWNVPGFTADHNDLSFTDAILDDLHANFNIDSNRIHSTGWSNGSMMSFYLTCERADVIASVAGVAAAMTTVQMAECQFTRPVSTMYIQGTADPIAPYSGTDDLTPAESTVDFYVDAFGCADATTTELPDTVPEDSSTVTFSAYAGCNENTEFHFYRVNNGGHTWPQGGSPQAAAPLGFKNEDFNANLTMLAFFADNPLPPTGTSSEDVDLPEFTMTAYPNPFAREITIDFQLAKSEKVEMILYNTLGQEVRTIANQVYLPGKQSITWKSEDLALPAGLYFVRLKAGKQQLTRSLLHVGK